MLITFEPYVWFSRFKDHWIPCIKPSSTHPMVLLFVHYMDCQTQVTLLVFCNMSPDLEWTERDFEKCHRFSKLPCLFQFLQLIHIFYRETFTWLLGFLTSKKQSSPMYSFFLVTVWMKTPPLSLYERQQLTSINRSINQSIYMGCPRASLSRNNWCGSVVSTPVS